MLLSFFQPRTFSAGKQTCCRRGRVGTRQSSSIAVESRQGARERSEASRTRPARRPRFVTPRSPCPFLVGATCTTWPRKEAVCLFCALGPLPLVCPLRRGSATTILSHRVILPGPAALRLTPLWNEKFAVCRVSNSRASGPRKACPTPPQRRDPLCQRSTRKRLFCSIKYLNLSI